MEQDSSERLNQITLADMELIPNTAHVYFEFLVKLITKKYSLRNIQN